MKIFISVLVAAALIIATQASIPSLSEVAHTMGYLDLNTNYSELWTTMHGDALAASAVETRDRDQIQAAMLLAGKVMSMGVSLQVETNGLSALCEIVTSGSVRDEFFSDIVFQRKKEEYNRDRKLFLTNSRFERQRERELFPFQEMLYVCTSGVPLSVKVAVVIAKSWSSSASLMNSFGLCDSLIPLKNPPPKLDTSFQRLIAGKASIGRSRVLRAVECEVFPSSLVPSWLYDVILEMLVGQLFGLAMKNKVAIPVSFDKKLLQWILQYLAEDDRRLHPAHVDRLRSGFYDIISKTAIVGNHRNPKIMLSERELGDVFKGIY